MFESVIVLGCVAVAVIMVRNYMSDILACRDFERRTKDIPARLIVDAHRFYEKDRAWEQAIERHESRLPGDCILCGADELGD